MVNAIEEMEDGLHSLDIVTQLMDALERKDAPAMLDLMAPEIVFHNLPWEPLDKAGTADFFDKMFGVLANYRVDILLQKGVGNIVFNERLEHFEFKAPHGGSADMPIAAVFELNDLGQVVAWREYFDADTWVRQGGPALD
ncbi:MAG: nuclear transport factor 2 family protein [Rhodospirillales bacterium]|nr:nuclear transport factor 2 family protein [Rhodospirillales bacterium]